MKKEWLQRKFQNIVASDRKSLLVIWGVTLLVFSNIFWNTFIMDDYSFIVGWGLIQNLWNMPRFFFSYIPPEAQGGIYSPLRTLIFALNFDAWKFNPVGYHVFSLLIHFIGIYFVYRLTLILVHHRLLAFLTALFFGVYPPHVESVTAITGSVDTVGVVALFAAFYYYVRAIDGQGLLAIGEEAPPHAETADSTLFLGANKKLYSFSLAFAFLAIFTHELTLMLPFLLVFYDIYFAGRVTSRRSIVFRLLPFFGMAFLYLISKWLVLGSLSRGHYLYGKVYYSLLVIIKVLVRYIWVSFFPAVLSHDPVISPGIFAFNEKDFNAQAVISQSFFDLPVVLSLFTLVAVAFIAVRSYQRQPLISFCVGWFFICLLPVSQIVPTSVFYGERYLYPGSWAACLLISLMIYKLFHWDLGQNIQRTKGHQGGRAVWSQRLGVTLAIGLLVFYSVRTFWRNFDLRNGVRAYAAALQMNPYSASLHNDLGIIFAEQEDYDQAITSILQAIAIKPQEPHYYFTLGDVYFRAGDTPNSIKALEQAVSLNPDFAEGYYNLASAYGSQGDEAKAKEFLDKAVMVYKKQGRILEAGEYANILVKSLVELKEQKTARETLP
jgi:protein O-mannosyl-transferase